jgi:hypothetical protein
LFWNLQFGKDLYLLTKADNIATVACVKNQKENGGASRHHSLFGSYFPIQLATAIQII